MESFDQATEFVTDYITSMAAELESGISSITSESVGLTGGVPTTSNKLSADTLKVAYDCALLSKLAYYKPKVVEELRQRANQETTTSSLKLTPEVTKLIDGDVVVSGRFKDAKNDLNGDKNETEYLRVLKQFKEKTDIHYFDAQTLVESGQDTKQSSQAYLFFSETPSTEKNVLYVAFRGTETDGEHEDWGDVWADLRLGFVPAEPKLIQKDSWGPNFTGEPMQLHEGFLKQFEALAGVIDSNAAAAVKRKLGEQVDELKDRSKGNGGIEVIVTGHSLGAALATIGSFVAAAKRPELKISCYNFGSPRVGNKAFADYYKAVMTGIQVPGEVYRFANKDDPVPHVPTPPGYHHVPVGGYKLEAGEDGTVEAEPLIAEHWISFDLRQLSGLAHEAAAWFHRNLFGLSFIENHEMNLYAEHIRKLKEKAEELGTTTSS